MYFVHLFSSYNRIDYTFILNLLRMASDRSDVTPLLILTKAFLFIDDPSVISRSYRVFIVASM